MLYNCFRIFGQLEQLLRLGWSSMNSLWEYVKILLDLFSSLPFLPSNVLIGILSKGHRKNRLSSSSVLPELVSVRRADVTLRKTVYRCVKRHARTNERELCDESFSDYRTTMNTDSGIGNKM
ncbi:uncharacterized protein LOC143151338 [Ptiloglossa arizonensis]|uniref:uncharacterized protein LOC143151338 n=1 Tax=Ptiloglossa arizonensis TaxID=3350558 RepID=UPI003FA038C6